MLGLLTKRAASTKQSNYVQTDIIIGPIIGHRYSTAVAVFVAPIYTLRSPMSAISAVKKRASYATNIDVC